MEKLEIEIELKKVIIRLDQLSEKIKNKEFHLAVTKDDMRKEITGNYDWNNLSKYQNEWITEQNIIRDCKVSWVKCYARFQELKVMLKKAKKQ